MSWLEDQSRTLNARWMLLAPRERRMISIAVTLVVLALLWWLALAPALKTLRAAPAENARLDTQLQQMATLQGRAEALKARPQASRDDALRALETSVREKFGQNAQLMTNSGTEGARLTLRAMPADTLTDWLVQARGNARAVPSEVHLSRAQARAGGNAPSGLPGQAAAAPAAGSGQARWEGALVMSLPGAR